MGHRPLQAIIDIDCHHIQDLMIKSRNNLPVEKFEVDTNPFFYARRFAPRRRMLVPANYTAIPPDLLPEKIYCIQCHH